MTTWLAVTVLAGLSAVIVNTIVSGAEEAAKLLPAGRPASTAAGLQIKVDLEAGLGCPPRNGMVYPAAAAPGLNASTVPGTGPRRAGATWDKNPAAFGAVPAGPLYLYLYLTGPTDHAVSVTGIHFRVRPRKPQVVGTWLNIHSECGGGGEYHYGIFDLDRPAPYQLPAASLPEGIRADALKFPYFTSANSPDAFEIEVRSEHCDCTWDAVLTWVDGATSHSSILDDHGRPFEFTSVTGLTGTAWSPTGASGAPTWTKETLTAEGQPNG